jgi:hypothetical protein
MLADPKLLSGFKGEVSFTEKKPVSRNLIHLAGHLKRRSILLFKKGHQPGEGLFSGLSHG